VEPIKVQSALIALLIFDLRADANASVEPRGQSRARRHGWLAGGGGEGEGSCWLRHRCRDTDGDRAS